MNTAPEIETSAPTEGSLQGSTASYDPGDNKLRLRSLHRLDRETYDRVKAAGFAWAPRQELFVAPAWSPEREDLLLELCGEIGDEDTSLVERAEVRADRFEGYSENRAADAEAARAQHETLSERFAGGQPILVGHHSEKRARKDAERVQNGIRRELKMWQTSAYWTRRAAGAVRAAKYKELHGVRQRRIKTLEADKRRHERALLESTGYRKHWSTACLTREQAMKLANYDHALPFGTWSALDAGEIGADDAQVKAVASHDRIIASAERWIGHLENRLAYERAMLGDTPEPPKPARRALAPMANFPGEGFHPMTKAEWAKLHKDYKGSRLVRGARVRTAMVRGALVGIYLTDSKRVDPPQAGGDAVPRFKDPEPEVRPTSVPRPAPTPSPEEKRLEQLRAQLKGGVKVVVVEQLFETPPELARMVVERAQVAGRRVLEPSAGLGALAFEAVLQGASYVACIEKDPRAAVELRRRMAHEPRIMTTTADFLSLVSPVEGDPERYDRIVMNPPFANGQDVAHVTRAYFGWLARGGRLVAVMSAGVAFRNDHKTKSFRAFVEREGTIEDLPDGSFKASGTDVRTVLVTLNR